MRQFRQGLVAALFLQLSIAYAAAAQADLPHVLVIATGGTIAGEQGEPGTLGGYEIRRPIGELVAQVPEIKRYAQVETEQFSNIPSAQMTPEQWLLLAHRINTVFEKRPDLAGIVVTHGTDRLEETAFFLHLTVKSDKPVVLVGAQRPPTGISPDGPLNLLSSVRVAGAHDSIGKGVLVVMDDRIISARDAQKVFARTGRVFGSRDGRDRNRGSPRRGILLHAGPAPYREFRIRRARSDDAAARRYSIFVCRIGRRRANGGQGRCRSDDCAEWSRTRLLRRADASRRGRGANVSFRRSGGDSESCCVIRFPSSR